MPLYEYRCSKCGKKFELLRKFSDPPVTVHAECGGHVERLISAPAFHLKGHGWYATDYAKKSPAADGKPEESKPGGDSDSKSEGKPDVKAEGKSETKSEAKTDVATDSKADSKSDAKPATPASKPDTQTSTPTKSD